MVDHPSETMPNNYTMARDLGHMLIGSPLGYGQNRSVWGLEHRSDLVLKLEATGDEFQNPMEWRVWRAVEGTALEKWFAPCVAISPNGVWLLQKKITFPPRSEYPPKLPAFFPDTKFMNFGKLGKQWCACDYGTPSFAWLLSKTARPTKAKWWGKDRDGVVKEDK